MRAKFGTALAVVVCFSLLAVPGLFAVDVGSAGEDYYFVTFSSVPSAGLIGEISSACAIQFGEYFQGGTYLAKIGDSSLSAVSDWPNVLSVRPYRASDKLSHNLKGAVGATKMKVVLHDDADISAATTELSAKGFAKSSLNTITVKYLLGTADAGRISEIAASKSVKWVDLDSPPVTFMNYITSNTYMGHDAVQAGGFRGSGMLAEVQDNGIDRLHPELTQVIYTDGTVVADSHGTCTSGIVFGTGSYSIMAQGIAYQATGAFSDWGKGRAASIQRLWNGTFNEGSAGMNGIVQSNSWGSGTLDGTYTANTNEIDRAAVSQPKVLSFWAIGNSNGGTGMGLMSQDAMGKNTMAIGAIFHKNTSAMTDDEYILQAAGNTPSRGWAADGRMKPDMCGPFDWIFTVDQRAAAGYTATNYYDNFGGTSGATPVNAGSGVLYYEMYKENYFKNNPTQALPYSSTIKALMIADAAQYDLARAPRIVQGWGTPDLENTYTLNATYHVINEYPQALASGQSWNRQVYSDGTKPLKIAVAWTDPAAPGTTGSGRTLINNLDLKVTSPGGTVYWGNNGLHNALWSVSGTGTNNWTRTASYTDDENNVECVFVQTPQAGQWTVEVQGHAGDVAQGPQQFSMVASGAKGISNMGTVALDKDVYRLEDTAIVTVADMGLNVNPALVETTTVLVNSTREPAGETITLTETGVDTSTFVGTITLSNTNGAGILWVAHGNTVRARYNDANNGTGPSTVYDSATVDGQAPAAPTALTVQWYGLQTLELYNETFEGDGSPTWAELGWTSGGASNDWQIGTPAGRGGQYGSPDPTGAHRGTFAIGNDITGLGATLGDYEASLAADSNYVYSKATNCVGATGSTLNFWKQLNVEQPTYDHAYIEVSNTGTTWTQVWTNTATITESGWSYATYSISGTADGQATVYVRFEIGSTDGSWQYSGWNIDDLVIAGMKGSRNHNTLNWTKSTDDGAGSNDVAKYNIYRANTAAGPWDGTTYLTSVAKGVQTYCDLNRGQSDGINWWYVVRAEDNIGNEEKNTVAVPEQMPTGTWANITISNLGWNLISVPIIATNTGIPYALTDRVNGGAGLVQWDRTMWYNPRTPTDVWKQLNKNWNAALNDMKGVNNTMGVWINVTSVGDGQICVGGANYTQPTTTATQLKAGWNMVGFPSDDTTYTVAMLKAACPSVTMVEQFDNGQTYKTIAMADATAFVQGRGYWIYTSADTVWNKAW